MPDERPDPHIRLAIFGWAASIVLIGVALIATSGFWLEATSAYLCGNDHEWRLPSPDGGKVAVRFHRDCGAFGNPATSVSVLARGDVQPNQAGNAFFAVDQGGQTERWGGPVLRMRWNGNGTLALTHDASDITWFADKPVNGVRIVVNASNLSGNALKDSQLR